MYQVGDDISILHTRATHLVRAILDCFAFAHGFGITVLLDEVTDADGIRKKIQIMQPELADHFTAFRNPNGTVDVDAFYRLVSQDPDLSLALNDLILAITVPGNIAIGCGRAIEALRTLIAPSEPDRKKAWALLRTALKLDQSYIEFVSAASTGPRHGSDRYLPTDDKHKEVIKRAWIIMNRFFEYRKRGSQELPLSEFTMLR